MDLESFLLVASPNKRMKEVRDEKRFTDRVLYSFSDSLQNGAPGVPLKCSICCPERRNRRFRRRDSAVRSL